MINREITNSDGTKDIIMIESNDNYKVNLNGKYKLANCYINEKSFSNKFKNSIFGADIGVKSQGFGSVLTLSLIIALGTMITLYFMWRI